MAQIKNGALWNPAQLVCAVAGLLPGAWPARNSMDTLEGSQRLAVLGRSCRPSSMATTQAGLTVPPISCLRALYRILQTTSSIQGVLETMLSLPWSLFLPWTLIQIVDSRLHSNLAGRFSNGMRYLQLTDLQACKQMVNFGIYALERRFRIWLSCINSIAKANMLVTLDLM